MKTLTGTLVAITILAWAAAAHAQDAVEVKTNNSAAVSTVRLSATSGADIGAVNVKNARLQLDAANGYLNVTSSAAAAPSAGDFRYDGANLRYYNGSAWLTLETTGGGSGSYLKRNATDTSSAAVAAGWLYDFTNSSGTAAGGLRVTSNAGYAVYGSIPAAATGTGYALFGYNQSTAATTQIGTYGGAIGAGPTNNTGVFGTANNSAGANYGVQGRSSGTSADNRGVYGLADGGAGTKYGLYGNATGVGTTNYGAYVTASGASTNNYGIRGDAQSATDTNYGGYFSAGAGSGAGTNAAVWTLAGNANVNYGIYASVGGSSGSNYFAGFFDVSAVPAGVGSSSVFASNASMTAATHYALRGTATGNTVTGTKYAVYGDASGTATTNYGVYGRALGGTTNWAGYFSGDVALGGTATASQLRLYEATGSGANYTAFVAQAQAGNVTYTLPASLTSGYVLSTDASGNLSWIDNMPATDGDYIQNATSAQTANYNVSNTGAANPVAQITGTASAAANIALNVSQNTALGDAIHIDDDDNASGEAGHYAIRLDTQGVDRFRVATNGDVYATGTVTGATWNGVAIGALYGGTGQTTVTTGDLLYGSAANTWSKLADVATGNALISGGVGVAPSWGKIGLTTHVSGTLPVGNGGTGTATAFNQGSVVFAGASGVYSQDNANFFWDDTNNRLGLGTASPISSLDVTGNVAGVYDGLRITNTNGVAASSARMTFLYFSTNDRTAYIESVPEFTGAVWTPGLAFGTGFQASLAERVRITYAGNVGIGTTTPATKLDVNGVINSATGYRVANAATSGNYLRGDGTNFVSSAIQAADIPASAASKWTDAGTYMNPNPAGVSDVRLYDTNQTYIAYFAQSNSTAVTPAYGVYSFFDSDYNAGVNDSPFYAGYFDAYTDINDDQNSPVGVYARGRHSYNANYGWYSIPRGVLAIADNLGSNPRQGPAAGIEATATGGGTYLSTYGGVYGGRFSGTVTNGTTYGAYGVYASATGVAGGTTYGIYATAAGGTTNWAGYFNGPVNITGNLSVSGTGPYVLKAGDTMTGALTMGSNAINFNGSQAIYNGDGTYLYVRSNGAGSAGIRLMNSASASYGYLYADGTNIGLLSTGGAWLAYTNQSGLFNTIGGLAVDGNTVIDDGGGWHRSYGNAGWYSQTWGGGWWMTDATWIRSYNSKNVYCDQVIRADGGFQVDAYQMIAADASMIYGNRSNLNGGGVWVSDDGGFYDYNDGWISFSGTSGVFFSNTAAAYCAIFDDNVVPNWNDTYTMGTSSYRWNNTYSVAGDFSGNVVLGDSTADTHNWYGVLKAGTTSDSHIIRPNAGNYSYVGNATYYFYYMYSNFFVDVSRRELKKDIHPLSEPTYRQVMADIDRINPAFYRYRSETDTLERGNEAKFRPGLHLGLFLDEAPDYIQDNVYSGIDIYALSSLSLAGVKYNRRRMEGMELRLARLEAKSTGSASDFGNAVMGAQDSLWVPFSEEFRRGLGEGSVPTVTVAAQDPSGAIYVSEKTREGFRVVRTSGGDGLSFDWIAMTKVPGSSAPAPEAAAGGVSPELMKLLRVPAETKELMRQWAAGREDAAAAEGRSLPTPQTPAASSKPAGQGKRPGDK